MSVTYTYQTADLVRWARNGEQWARAACDRLGIAWRTEGTPK